MGELKHSPGPLAIIRGEGKGRKKGLEGRIGRERKRRSAGRGRKGREDRTGEKEKDGRPCYSSI